MRHAYVLALLSTDWLKDLFMQTASGSCAVVYTSNRLMTIDRILVGGEGGSKVCSTRSLYRNVRVEYTQKGGKNLSVVQ